MATHSSILAWRIPWTKEPDKLQSMGSQRVGHDWVTSLSFFLSASSSFCWGRKIWGRGIGAYGMVNGRRGVFLGFFGFFASLRIFSKSLYSIFFFPWMLDLSFFWMWHSGWTGHKEPRFYWVTLVWCVGGLFYVSCYILTAMSNH